jgi:chromosome segregation ATPase
MSSDERAEPGSDALSVRIEQAQQRLSEAAESAETAEKRATAEIRALEADLEKEKLNTAEALESVRAGFAEDLKREREAKEQAIASAEGRLAEIEAHAEAAERRVKEAERRASEAEGRIADARAEAREAAAAWLRDQVKTIRREAAGR